MQATEQQLQLARDDGVTPFVDALNGELSEHSFSPYSFVFMAPIRPYGQILSNPEESSACPKGLVVGTCIAVQEEVSMAQDDIDQCEAKQRTTEYALAKDHDFHEKDLPFSARRKDIQITDRAIEQSCGAQINNTASSCVSSPQTQARYTKHATLKTQKNQFIIYFAAITFLFPHAVTAIKVVNVGLNRPFTLGCNILYPGNGTTVWSFRNGTCTHQSDSIYLVQASDAHVSCDSGTGAISGWSTCGSFNASNAPRSSTTGNCLSSTLKGIGALDMNGMVIKCSNTDSLTSYSQIVEEFQIHIVDVPSAPVSLHISSDCNHISFEWNPDNAGNIESYEIVVTNSTSATTLLIQKEPGNASGTIISGLRGGSTYTITIIASNAAGYSNSSVRHIHIPECIASKFMVIEITSNSATVQCAFDTSKPLYCVVCCSAYSSVISSTRGTNVTVQLNGLTSSQTYNCTAVAANHTTAVCNGQGSNMFNFTTSSPSPGTPLYSSKLAVFLVFVCLCINLVC